MSWKAPVSWREALARNPGPKTPAQALVLALKGLAMGAADTIPGVSGGTMALITGIYEDLLAAVKSVDARAIGCLLRFDIKGAVAQIHVRFLLALFCGIGAAVLTLARIMNYLLNHHPQLTWSLFFGLIGASIWVVGRKVKRWGAGTALSFFFGAAAAFQVVALVPATTPETPWFIFLSGMIAICAMILPGLSGAFILVILGKYEFITATLKNPLDPVNLGVILVFGAGCMVGLAGFSRVLKFLLDSWYNLTLAFLTGLMAGSLRKVWPWKEVLEQKIVDGEVLVLQERNVLPDALNPEILFAVSLMVVGFAAVMALEKLSDDPPSAY